MSGTFANIRPAFLFLGCGKACWLSSVSSIDMVVPSVKHAPLAFPGPLVLSPSLNLLSSPADQSRDDPQRESLTRVAVASGVRRARHVTMDRQPNDQSGDRRTTRVVRAEGL